MMFGPNLTESTTIDAVSVQAKVRKKWAPCKNEKKKKKALCSLRDLMGGSVTLPTSFVLGE